MKLLTFFMLLCFIALPARAEQAPIYLLTVDGAIGPAFADYMNNGITKAEVEGAQAVIVALNTPGGLLTTTRNMVSRILEAQIPVIVWVTPSGAHAASAGTFILYAAHIAVMDKSTNVGAATPIEMRGQVAEGFGKGEEDNEKSLRDMLKDLGDPNQKAMRNKAIKDTSAFIRGLAELRGRNAEWAERAVTEADSLTAEEALAQNVIDFIATNETMLLQQIDGMEVPIKNAEPVTLQTSEAPIVRLDPDWKTQLMAMITDPNVAFILMSVGVYGLILEFYNPGSMIPGTIGVVSLVIGLYALNVLPINAAGVLLLLLGIGFMIAEAFIPSFGIMGIMGVAAFIFGATIMFDTEFMPGLALDPGLVWGVAIFGLVLVALVTLLTVRTYKKQISTGTESMIGQKAKIFEWNKTKGMVRIQGELWHAESDQPMELGQGDEVRVLAVDNLILRIDANS